MDQKSEFKNSGFAKISLLQDDLCISYEIGLYILCGTPGSIFFSSGIWTGTS